MATFLFCKIKKSYFLLLNFYLNAPVPLFIFLILERKERVELRTEAMVPPMPPPPKKQKQGCSYFLFFFHLKKNLTIWHCNLCTFKDNTVYYRLNIIPISVALTLIRGSDEDPFLMRVKSGSGF